jgi:tetratricopeptide (TPR) repeat protein
MRRPFLGVLGMLLTAAALVAANGTRILLVARDLENRPLSGIRFAYAGVESQETSKTGATELDLASEMRAGQQIKVQILAPAFGKADEWMLVNDQVNVPMGSAPAEVVLMRRSTFRQIADEVRDAARGVGPSGELTEEVRKRVLVEAATRHGLTEGQIEAALRSFAETQDSKDRGIAAYIMGQYIQAEELLNKAAERQESDLVDTLRYLGATQYERGKYRVAADSFRKALALHPEDTTLLSWLVEALRILAEWTEAESLIRQALAIDEKNCGMDHPNVAIDLNNLGALLVSTDRLAEAEPLIRRALAIDEKSLGVNHPRVASTLSSLAQLLDMTSRAAEAEPLMRRALAIDERSFGTGHPFVAGHLNNLALVLHSTNRLAEAEPLIRRALAIDEASLGTEHPNVARDLSTLALLLQGTNRLAEAELLMRRALSIKEKSFGTEHPSVAFGLHNLALLLRTTNRLAEAEPLMRRELAIYEKRFGPDHPNIAAALGVLAQLLKETNQLAEAELLMRRALAILIDVSRRNKHDHPNRQIAADNYTGLLKAMGKTDAEIDAIMYALARAQD